MRISVATVSSALHPSGSKRRAANEPSGEAVAGDRRLRRSYEVGHRPKFLVLVDDTEDCGKAVYYASRRAARVGAHVVLLRVIEPLHGELGWLGVEDVIQIEAQQEAQQLLDRYVILAQSVSEELPETIIRQGAAAQQIFKLIEADEDIAVLVLAAGSSNKGPGLLISELARTAGTYPVPVVIVPAHLSDLELDALS
jgi:nucleotide-binding universal stress UspA family protein